MDRHQLAAAAERELERADWIRNADNWPGDRDGPAEHHNGRAQVFATLAVAEALAELVDETRAGTKAVYDGRI